MGSDRGGHQVAGRFVVEALAAEPAPAPEIKCQPDQRVQSLGLPAARGEAGGQVAGQLCLHAIEALLHEPIQLGHGRAVAEELAEHRLGLSVPAVQAGERGLDALDRVLQRERLAQVRRWMEGRVVGRAGREQLAQTREMVVDR